MLEQEEYLDMGDVEEETAAQAAETPKVQQSAERAPPASPSKQKQLKKGGSRRKTDFWKCAKGKSLMYLRHFETHK